MTATSVFVFLLLLVVVGRLLRRFEIVPASSPDTLNLLALYVSMPAAVLLNVPQLKLERALLGVIATPWILLAVTIAVVLPLARVVRMDRATRACLLGEIPMGNTAFMGYALVPALAGKEALGYAVVYDQFGSFLILGTYGLFVIALHAGSERPTVRTIARRVLTFPAFLALVFALTLMPKAPPEPVRRGLEMLSGMLLPLVALGLGMQLKLRLPRAYLRPLVLGMIGKLVVLPLLAVGICWLFGIAGPMRSAVILESAMPTMMTTGALLALAGLAPDFATAMVGYTTVASVVTLPIVQRLLL